LKFQARYLYVAFLATAVSFVMVQSAFAAKKGPDASPSAAAASASPAPLPTATPEPADVAIPRLEAKIKANPSDKDSLQELAGFYLAVGKPDQALALTQRLLSLGVKTAQVYYLDGIADQTLGRVKEATGDFESATTLEPTNAQILLTLTNLYLQTNRASDAERVAKRATTFNATDKRVFENYGLVLGQEGKFDEARAQFENAAKRARTFRRKRSLSRRKTSIARSPSIRRTPTPCSAKRRCKPMLTSSKTRSPHSRRFWRSNRPTKQRPPS
jgi:tetratricopeptide (TPR) repeat protein